MRRIHWEADLSVQTGTGHSIVVRGDSSASKVEISGPGGIAALRELAKSGGGLLQLKTLLASFVLDACSIRVSGIEVATISTAGKPGWASRIFKIPGLRVQLFSLGRALLLQK